MNLDLKNSDIINLINIGKFKIFNSKDFTDELVNSLKKMLN